jgi:hypothetical protein
MSVEPGRGPLAETTERQPGGYNLVGVAANYKEALRAVDELRSHAGLSDEDISVIARHPDPPNDSLHGTPAGTPEPQDEKSISRGAAAGGVAGGVGGLALGLASLLIPGIGPVLATGVFASVLGGAAAGAATGGFVGVLRDQGLPEDRAQQFEQRLHKGEVIVSAYAPTQDQAEVAREVLERYEALANRPL